MLSEEEVERDIVREIGKLYERILNIISDRED